MTSSMLPAPTARLRFRKMVPSDLDLMASLLGDPEVMRFYPAPKSRGEAARWIEWNQRNYAEHGFGLWLIETHDGGFVGDCGLTMQKVNGALALEVGYHVRSDLQGQGLATEASAACRDYARDRTNATDLFAIIHPGNLASRRVTEKLGMRPFEEDAAYRSLQRTVYSMQL